MLWSTIRGRAERHPLPGLRLTRLLPDPPPPGCRDPGPSAPARRAQAVSEAALAEQRGIYGACFRGRVQNLGVEEVLIAPRSPWQSPFVERVIGTLRRELLDHVIVLSEQHLRRLLRTFVAEYYHLSRTHLSLGKDSPDPRSVEPPDVGQVIQLPVVGGLHHRYTRRAA